MSVLPLIPYAPLPCLSQMLQSQSQHLPPSSKGPSQALPLGVWELKPLSLQEALYTKMGQSKSVPAPLSPVETSLEWGWRGRS